MRYLLNFLKQAKAIIIKCIKQFLPIDNKIYLSTYQYFNLPNKSQLFIHFISFLFCYIAFAFAFLPCRLKTKGLRAKVLFGIFKLTEHFSVFSDQFFFLIIMFNLVNVQDVQPVHFICEQNLNFYLSKSNGKRWVKITLVSSSLNDIDQAVKLLRYGILKIMDWFFYRESIVIYSSIVSVTFNNLASLLSEYLEYSTSGSLNKLTVIRSPFVYKKTREQFGFITHKVSILFQCSQFEQELIVMWLNQVKFPVEIKITLVT